MEHQHKGDGMKFLSNDLIYFIGVRELEKEYLKKELERVTSVVKSYQEEVKKLTKEKDEIIEKKLVG